MPPRGNHIGTLIKPHGYKGELILSGKGSLLEKLEPGTALFIDISGQQVPFFIEELQEIGGNKCILKLEFIESDIEARKYIACEVYDDLKYAGINHSGPGNLLQLIGYTVVDLNSGSEFHVKEVEENNDNPILLLENEGNEVMLPALADYIIEFNHSKRIIQVEFPEGLMET